MVGRPTLTTPPAFELLSLDMAKLQLRIDAGDTSQDSYLQLLLSSARETAEIRTTRRYVFQKYREYYDHFPGHAWRGEGLLLAGEFGRAGFGHMRRHGHNLLELSRSSLRKLVQVQYLDSTGALQTLDPSQYVVNDKQDPASIGRAPSALGGLPWPVTLREVNSVWVDYTVGANVLVASIAANAAVLTGVSGYTFTAADAGTAISVPGAGIGGGPLLTTVASVDGSGNATLATGAVSAAAGVTALLGPQPPIGDMNAMLLLISHWYENRIPVQQGGAAIEAPYMIKDMLDRQRVYYQP